ncbi:MAG: DUF1232 domain-containing protein [Anaerolineaceae bacterium]|jgi:hypothetical protein|nr:DUF1232 domain-containing protein [Anaerolineaceae bacterium]MDD4042095.1 DUF1232 domain-containing protein [Anaerolineaceae bacterium]MDD4578311.1 DUF1232 domain-containing protein [Anaerolineaceae bacterium]
MKDPKIIDIGNPPDPQEEPKKTFNFRPLSSYGFPRWLVYLAAAAGFLYILNPTFGIIELIPDNLPIIGNLDEGVAFLLVMYGVLELMEGKKDID